MSQKTALALAAVVASFAIVACTAPTSPGPGSGSDTKTSKSPTDTNDDDGNGTGTGTGSGTGTGTGATPGTTPPGPGTTPPDAVEACFDACDAATPGGSQVMDTLDDQWTTCACAKCATQCGQSFCAANPTDPAAGDACSTCLDTATSCDTQWETACNANADCKKLDACQLACEPAGADDDD